MIDARPGTETDEYTQTHCVSCTVHTDSLMYGFYLAHAKSSSQMIASGPAVAGVRRLLLSRLVGHFKRA